MCSHMNGLHEWRFRIHKTVGSQNSSDLLYASIWINHMLQHGHCDTRIKRFIYKWQIMCIRYAMYICTKGNICVSNIPINNCITSTDN